jgi:hypothetical protein
MKRYLFVLFSLAPAFAFAKSSDDFVRAGNAAWTSFQCSTYAEILKNRSEQERLFKYGYQVGQEYVTAIFRKEVSQESLKNVVYAAVVLRSVGPSPEFTLGRLFEGAVGDAWDKVNRKDGQQYESQEIATIKAKTEFAKNKCELIGR